MRSSRQAQDEALATIFRECRLELEPDGKPWGMYVKRDKDGNIAALMNVGIVRPSKVADEVQAHVWNMPGSLGELNRLQKLSVYNCARLPREIGKLSALKELSLHFCTKMESLPIEIAALHSLQDVRIHGDIAMKSVIANLRGLRNLRYFYYRSAGQGVCTIRDYLVNDLLDDKVQFKHSLEYLEIEGAHLLEDHVAELFSRVLPFYPKLERLHLQNNMICSLDSIVKALPDVIPSTIRLRRLNLLRNPVLDSSGNQKEKDNLLTLVKRHEELISLGRGITECDMCTTECLLEMDLNDGGKVLLSKRFRPIPLSVWPVVLERAGYLQSYHAPVNVVYHLLRNGAALGKRGGIPESNGNSGGSRKRKAG
jgi:hypothetical protein